MSGTVSRGREAGQQGEAQAAAEARGSRGHHRWGGWAAVGLVALAAAGAVSAWRAGAFSSAAASGAGQGAPAPATAAVTRQDLIATTPVTATLGYAGSYLVRGQGGGTLTWLPPAGQIIRQGQSLYRTGDETPVILLYGSVPAWRPLGAGVTGQDVSQLNHDLVAAIVAVLGLAASSQAALLAEIARLGTNLLTVTNGQTLTGATAERPEAAPQMIGRPPEVTAVAATGTLSNSPDPALLAAGGQARAVPPSTVRIVPVENG